MLTFSHLAECYGLKGGSVVGECDGDDLTYPDVVEDPLELQRLILSLHGGGIKTVASVDELDDVTRGAAHSQVVLGTQVLQGLHQTPLKTRRAEI